MTHSTPECRTVWETIFHEATRHASQAMSRWTSGQIVLSLDEVCEVPLEDVGDRLGIGDTLSNIVILEVAESPSGQLILVFDNDNASQLVGALLNRPAIDSDSWGELESSALRRPATFSARLI